MTTRDLDAEIDRIKSVLGPAKTAHVAIALAGVRAMAKTGPDVAEALTNAIVVHAMGQPDPLSCVESVATMLRAGVELFLFMRAEAAVKS